MKNADRVRPEDLRGLTAFGDEYPEARRVLLYRGADRLVVRDIPCVPVGDFLTRLHPRRGLKRAIGHSGGRFRDKNVQLVDDFVTKSSK